MLMLITKFLAVLFSVLAAACFYCFMITISLIFSIGGGARTLVAFVARTGEITCFLLCVAIVIFYFWLRYKNDYEKGIWTDLLIVIVLFVPFYKLCGYLHPMVENWQWLRDFLDAILC